MQDSFAGEVVSDEVGRKSVNEQRAAVQEGPVFCAPGTARRWGECGKGLEEASSGILSSAVEPGE